MFEGTMAANQINVNNTDINGAKAETEMMPLDVMGLLFFAYRDFVGAPDELLERRGFGRAHHRVLYFVNVRPGMPVADLLSILKITKQSLARVLRQLIDDGYIEQHPGHTDRRQRLLYATQKGQEFFATLSRSQASRINAALDNLTPEAANQVRRFLMDMVDTADRATLEDLHLTEKIDR